jgi:bifunctional non-homologous end joining protein LigD
MHTPDGAWRVEVVRRGHTHWYRLLHGDNQLDWLTIAAVQRLLGEAGIALAALIEVTDPRPEPADNSHPGVA